MQEKGSRLDLTTFVPNEKPKRLKDTPLKKVDIHVEIPLENNLRYILLTHSDSSQNNWFAQLFDRTIRLELHIERHPRDIVAKEKHGKLRLDLLLNAIKSGVDYQEFWDKYFEYRKAFLEKASK